MPSAADESISAKPEVRAARREYLTMLAEWAVAEQRLQLALSGLGGAMGVVREHLERDGLARDFEDLIAPGELRAELSDAFNSFERIRHKTQNRLYQLLVAEGLSYTDIGKMWGISRQLVSRIASESL